MNLRLSRRAVIRGSGLAGLAGLAAHARPAAALAADSVTGRPMTIPAVRHWEPDTGHYTLPAVATLLVAPSAAPALRATADRLSQEVTALTGRPARVEVSGRRPRAGDVHLSMAPLAGVPVDGHAIHVGSHLGLVAGSSAGVHHATRTVLQLLRQSDRITGGTIRDWPRFTERGLMVDLGRKYLSPAWLADRVFELSYLKLDYLHLHLSDHEAFRIENERFPEVVAKEHLTKAEIRELIQLATLHHVTVVPEIDMPGHLTAALAPFPQFQLRDAAGRASAGRLDFTIDAARQWAKDLVSEYLELFPAPYLHIGADEFLPAALFPLYPQLKAYAQDKYGPEANEHDAFIDFLNEVAAFAATHGKRLRVWNDGLAGARVARLSQDVVVDWWNDVSTLGLSTDVPLPADLVAAGHEVQNAGWWPTYYVNGTNGTVRPKPDVTDMYERWDVHEFRGELYVTSDVGTPQHELEPQDPRLLGSVLHVWNDDPESATPAEIAAGIAPRLRVMAQKTWQSPSLVRSYAEFAAVQAVVGGPPR